jgi:hypothetical protein
MSAHQLFDTKGASVTFLAVFLTVFTAQTSLAFTPDQIVEQAVAQNIADTKRFRETYDFDTIKCVTKDGKVVKNEEGASDRLTIEELFRKNRYIYEIDETVLIDGLKVIAIRFSPRPNKQPNAPKGANTRGKVKNDILNHLRGVIYIEQEGLGIVRVVIRANKSSESIYVVGRLYKMDAILEQCQLGDIWVPEAISVESEFSYFLGLTRRAESTTILFQNFRLKAP